MRLTVLAWALGVAAGAAQAAPDALVIGNSRYDPVHALFGVPRVIDAVPALEAQGFDVSMVRDADSASMRLAVARFLEQLELDSAPVLVMLAGAFVHGPGGSYLLPGNADLMDPEAMLGEAFAVDTAMTVLARYPERAVLVLAETVAPEDTGIFLDPGLGPLQIPAGVTVIRGAATDVARFTSNILTSPGAMLIEEARRFDLVVAGFVPAGFEFLPGAPGAVTMDLPLATDLAALPDVANVAIAPQPEPATGAAPEAAQQETQTVAAGADQPATPVPQDETTLASTATPDPDAGQDGMVFSLDETTQVLTDAERAAAAILAEELALQAEQDDADWAVAQEANSLEGYRVYLDAWPEGRHSPAARQRISAIQSEPFFEERQAEADLALSLETRRSIQGNLALLDHDPQGIDGIFGPNTRTAIQAWQETAGLEETGYLTTTQIARLADEAKARTEELEAAAREQERNQQRQALRTEESYWSETGGRGSEAGLRTYLKRYPNGKYAANARLVLSQLEETRRRRASGGDRVDWERATATDTITAYQRYLSDRPGGAFVNEARGRIAELQGVPTDDDAS